MLLGHIFLVCFGFSLAHGQLPPIIAGVDLQTGSRVSKDIKFPLFDWLFGRPATTSIRKNTTSETANQTQATTSVPLERILPLEELTVRNSTFKRFVLKKEAQDQINDKVYRFNHNISEPKESNVSSNSSVNSDSVILNSTTSSTTEETSTPKIAGSKREGRQLFGEEPYHEHMIELEPYRRGNWHHHRGHRRKHYRSAPEPEPELGMPPPSSQLMKRQGMFPMTLTPQQQMYLQQVAMLQRQQQQLLAISGLSGLMGNSAMDYYLRSNGNNGNDNGNNGNTIGNGSGNGNSINTNKDTSPTRKRRRPSSYYDYEDKDSEEDYYDDDDDDGDDGSEFDSEELVQDFLTPDFRSI